MKPAIRAAFSIVCGLLVMCGCSRQKSRFAREIAPADSIAFVNDWGETNAITNRDEVSKLVQAVRSAKRDRHHYSATFQSRLRFYSGTNLLDEVRFQDRAFWIKDEQYSEDSGLLGTLYRKPRTFE